MRELHSLREILPSWKFIDILCYRPKLPPPHLHLKKRFAVLIQEPSYGPAIGSQKKVIIKTEGAEIEV